MNKIKYIAFENQITLYWFYESYADLSCYKESIFKIFINDKEIGSTKVSHYEIKNLKENTKYEIRIMLFDSLFEEVTIRTLPKRKKVVANCDNSGTNNVTKEIQNLINNLKEDEELVFKKGTYLCGALFVSSNKRIYLEKDAVIKGSGMALDYPYINSRFEGIEMVCRSSLINIGELDHTKGYTTSNIVIYGEGSIIGGGLKLLKDTILKEKPTATEEDFNKNGAEGRKRGRLINISNAENIVISGLTLGFSPSWNIHMIYSSNIVTCNCFIKSYGIHNGDGWNPDSSTNCTLFGTTFDVGDDCVAIKSGKNPEGNIIARETSNIHIFDCHTIYGHGVAMGSEISGGVSHVFIYDNDFEKSLAGLHIKTTKKRGGYVKNIYVYNTKLAQIRIATVPYNDDGESSNQITTFENINVHNCSVTGRCFWKADKVDERPFVEIKGFEDYPTAFNKISISGLTIKNNKDNGIVVEHADAIVEDIILN